MFDPESVASLVPDAYAHWRSAVGEAVALFFSSLPAGRIAEVMAIADDLPAGASDAERLAAVLHTSPALHKLAQVLARRPELDGDLRRRLQQLEVMEPLTPLEDVLPLLHRELGPAWQRRRVRVEERPLAEASVAVVVGFTYESGDGERREGVFKVLKPGIEQRLEEDLTALARVANYLDVHGRSGRLPAVEYRETLDEVARLLASEVRLDREQSHLREAERFHAGHAGVHVPELLERLSTPRVTAMERIRGRKVTARGCAPDAAGAGCVAAEEPSAASAPSLASRLARAMVTSVLFADEELAPFHGDPHAGNLMLDGRGRIVPIDWALAGHLCRRERAGMFALLRAGQCGDEGGVTRALLALAAGGGRPVALAGPVRAALAQLRGRLVPNIAWMLSLLDAAAAAGLRFPANLLLFRKAYFTLEGVLHDLDPAFRIDWTMTAAVVEQLAREWPTRLVRPVTDRAAYGTAWSTLDIWRMLAAGMMRAAGV